MTNEQVALGHLRMARKAMLDAKSATPTRELSVALTECDTAILWLQFDIQCKTPPQLGVALPDTLHEVPAKGSLLDPRDLRRVP